MSNGMKKHTPLIVGNWKMNPANVGKAKELALAIRDGLGRRKTNVDIVVAPPTPFISEVERITPSKRVVLAAQTVFFEDIGAHTGEVSAPMLKSVGVEYVIVGHSERRARGESEHEIYQDIQAINKSGLNTIVCVGETERDKNGNYFSVVEAQLRSAVRDIPKGKLHKLVVAYEPVWAIGTGATATADDVHEMKLFIQKVIADIFGRTAINKVRILYGGSVKAKNAKELFAVGEVDGFLIGGASLKPKEFVSIINTAETYAA